MGNHHHGHDHQHDHSTDGLPDLLDLDAEVLHAYQAEFITQVAETAGEEPRRILDLGSGTGAGTLALAARFPAAELIAVDVSPDMLERLRAKAGHAGVGDRVQTVPADLDEGWPNVDDVDLVWASASMHHVADPVRVLRNALGAIRPGGLIALVEAAGMPRFLPDSVGNGVEGRLHAALAANHAEEMPHRGADWGPLLEKAGFAVVAAPHYRINLVAPLPPATPRYAHAVLNRMRTGLHDRLSAEDRATLHTLLDGHGPETVLERDDLTVVGDRTAWIGRRQ
jgi:trans-aconitate methyltransferase